MELKYVIKLKEANSANQTYINKLVDEMLDNSLVNMNTIDLIKNKSKRRRLDTKVTDLDDDKVQTKFNKSYLSFN